MKKEELILYKNAQSLLAHEDEIQHQIMKRLNSAIIALSETRLTAKIEDNEVNISGYNQMQKIKIQEEQFYM